MRSGALSMSATRTLSFTLWIVALITPRNTIIPAVQSICPLKRSITSSSLRHALVASSY